jgi:hypothetical protein
LPRGCVTSSGPRAPDRRQVLRFREAEHVAFNLMFDRLSMLEQLGLSEAVAAGRSAVRGRSDS